MVVGAPVFVKTGKTTDADDGAGAEERGRSTLGSSVMMGMFCAYAAATILQRMNVNMFAVQKSVIEKGCQGCVVECRRHMGRE
jgi:hypothetical protein